jgi:hypothetical protein
MQKIKYFMNIYSIVFIEPPFLLEWACSIRKQNPDVAKSKIDTPTDGNVKPPPY